MESKKPLEIIIAPENKVEFQDIFQICLTHRDIRRPIPTSVVLRLFEIMDSANGYNLRRLFDESKLVSKKVVKRLESMKGYKLLWEEKIMAEGNDSVKPDSEQVFTEMIYLFSLYKNDYKKAGRDEAVAFFYLAFEEKYKYRLQADVRENFTLYKQAVISGIIAMAMGYRLSNKAELTNGEIFQATRNAISKKYKD